MRRRVFSVIFCVILALAAGVRIYQVNTADYYRYFPVRKFYSRGEQVPLNNDHYYFTRRDWSGYTVEVTDARIEKTEAFLAERHAPEGFLAQNGYVQNNHHAYDYLCIVTAVFRYDGTDSLEKDPVSLAEFKLLGPDYTLASVPELNGLPAFNSSMKGNSRFVITSGKPFTVEIPFFISTGFETDMSVEYFQKSDPQLLVTYYPEESCIAVFSEDAP